MTPLLIHRQTTAVMEEKRHHTVMSFQTLKYLLKNLAKQIGNLVCGAVAATVGFLAAKKNWFSEFCFKCQKTGIKAPDKK